MEITLFIPELIWPEAEDHATLDGLPCPVLERLLARGKFQRQASRSFEAGLAGLWQLNHATSLAQLRLQGEFSGTEAQSEGRRWVCADPVHLRFHQERIILGDAGTFQLEMAEAQAVVASLNQEFADIGQFHAAHPQRWYLSLNQTLELSTPPLSAVAGRQLAPEQLAAPHHGWLRRLQNEIQMVLHSHPVNTAREAAGKPAINSLWLWGDGQPHDHTSAPFDSVWSNHPLARGLAECSGAVVHPEAPMLAEVLARNCSQHTLVVLETLLTPTLYEDGIAWRQGLEALEHAWFAPLADALARGKIQSARLITSGLHGQMTWDLAPGDRWRFWVRPQPLAQLTKTIAESTRKP